MMLTTMVIRLCILHGDEHSDVIDEGVGPFDEEVRQLSLFGV